MTNYSPEFNRILQFTAQQTFTHREPTLAEIDPELAAEIDSSPTYTRSLWGEWGDLRSAKVFSGIVDEGGEPIKLKLHDGNIIEIQHIGHLNVDRAGADTLHRHILDIAGVVYEEKGDSYAAMSGPAIDSLVDELELVS